MNEHQRRYLNSEAVQGLISDSINWDDRKQVSDAFQEAGGKLDDLSDETYSALLAVARWGAERVLYLVSDEDLEGGAA